MRYGFKKLLNSLSLVDKDCIDLPEKPETLQYSINPLMCFVSIGEPLWFGILIVFSFLMLLQQNQNLVTLKFANFGVRGLCKKKQV